MDRDDRVTGCVLGWAVGDALGAPFEFGPAHAFTERFPRGGRPAEMCGGGGWAAGEATDDTQMGVMVARSLLEHGRLEPRDVFARFRHWAASDPKDIGLQTREVLTSGLPWNTAAAHYLKQHHLAAGNGSLMRAVPLAVFAARRRPEERLADALTESGLTHADRSTGWGCFVYQELIRTALDGEDPLPRLPALVDQIDAEHRDHWAAVLAQNWHPELATEPNGAVWPTLGSAVWALRRTGNLPDALRAAIDLGNDTDTVAAVTGGLVGAVYGRRAIPPRWLVPLHVNLPDDTRSGPGERPTAGDRPGFGERLGFGGLLALARALDGGEFPPPADA